MRRRVAVLSIIMGVGLLLILSPYHDVSRGIVMVTKATYELQDISPPTQQWLRDRFEEVTKATNELQSGPGDISPPTQQWLRDRVDEVRTHLNITYTPPSNWNASRSYHIYHYPKIKMILTAIPKSGCTNWIQAMRIAEGLQKAPLKRDKVWVIHNFRNRRLARLSDKEMSTLNESLSVAVIRNPWTRMVSGYCDKIGPMSGDSPGKTLPMIARRIVARARNMTVEEAETQNLYPTFPEFIKMYVVPRGQKKIYLDVHFKPQYPQLHLKNVQYDYIVPLEHSPALYPEVMRHTNSSSEALKGSYDATSDPRVSTTKEWFGQLEPHLIEELYDIFRPDFILGNYTNFTDPNFPLPGYQLD
eukprot:sb/3466060/